MIKSIILAAALLTVGAVTPANAEMYCSGDQNFVSCSGSEYDYESGRTIYCSAAGNPDYLNWDCTSY